MTESSDSVLPAAGTVTLREQSSIVQRWSAAPIPGITVPSELVLLWPRAVPATVVEAFESEWAPDPESVIDDCVSILSALAPVHLEGSGLLSNWSLRVEGGRLVAFSVPGLAQAASEWAAPFNDPPDQAAARDRYLLGAVLFRCLTGRWASSRIDAVTAAGVLGGRWATGADFLIRSLMSPEVARSLDSSELAFVVNEVRSPIANLSGAEVGIVSESVTGWQKARGREAGDNEDIAAWARVEGSVAAILGDGVSGGGTGSGLAAARVIAETAGQYWSGGGYDPFELLDLCHAAVSSEGREWTADKKNRPAAAAISAAILPDLKLVIASMGDSVAFLCRATKFGPVVMRLTGEHSRISERLTEGDYVRAEDLGVVTCAVGVHDTGRAHKRMVQLRPGDQVVLVTDGASKASSGDAGLECFQFEEDLTNLVSQTTSPALLASLLCRRAEDLGGTDNATALVMSVTSSIGTAYSGPDVDRGWLRRLETAPVG